MRKRMCAPALSVAATLMATGCVKAENPFQTMADAPVVERAAAVPSALPVQLWPDTAAKPNAAAGVDASRRLVGAFPHSAAAHLALIDALDAARDYRGALEAAAELAAMGYVFSEERYRRLLGMNGTGRVAPFLLQEPPGTDDPLPVPETLTSLPSGANAATGVLHDAAYDRILLTDDGAGRYWLHEAGRWLAIPVTDGGLLSAPVVDERRGLVWLASHVEDEAGGAGAAFLGAIALDRATLEPRRRIPAPNGVRLAGLAIGPDGTVYATDTATGMVWVAGPSNARFQTLVSAGVFVEPRGLSVRPDGRVLYVADHDRGLAAVTLPNAQIYRVDSASSVMMDGIAHLAMRGGELVALHDRAGQGTVTALRLGYGIAAVESARMIVPARTDGRSAGVGSVLGNLATYVAPATGDIRQISLVERTGN